LAGTARDMLYTVQQHRVFTENFLHILLEIQSEIVSKFDRFEVNLINVTQQHTVELRFMCLQCASVALHGGYYEVLYDRSMHTRTELCIILLHIGSKARRPNLLEYDLFLFKQTLKRFLSDIVSDVH